MHLPVAPIVPKAHTMLESLADISRRQMPNTPSPSPPPGFNDARDSVTSTARVISVGAIVGIVIGGVVFIAVIVLIVWLVKRRNRVARGAGKTAGEFRYGAGAGSGWNTTGNHHHNHPAGSATHSGGPAGAMTDVGM